MSVEGRIKAALEAAATWEPSMQNQDPAMIRLARRHFAEGYAAALWDAGLVGRVPGPLEKREYEPLEHERPVAPC